MCPTPPRFRLAVPADARSVAALHADSWRRHYRGAYSDGFLDGDVTSDRLVVWSERLHSDDSRRRTILAEDDDGLVGFAHSVLDDDENWGTLLDNLHVVYTHQRRGIGARLLAATVEIVVESAAHPGLYLWVLEQNVRAQAFYRAQGGEPVGRKAVSPPGGIPGRLHGAPIALRYAWSNPRLLVAATPR